MRWNLFHPDRVASRILGMGDVLSLIDKVSESIDAKTAEKMQEKLLERRVFAGGLSRSDQADAEIRLAGRFAEDDAADWSAEGSEGHRDRRGKRLTGLWRSSIR